MELNRRQFLKALSLTIAASQLPSISLAEGFSYAHFNPNFQYGDYVETTDFIDKSLMEEAVNILDCGIKKTIPPRYRDKIKWIIAQPKPNMSDPLSIRGSVGWKYDRRHKT